MGCTDARGMHGQGKRAGSQVREDADYVLGCLIVRGAAMHQAFHKTQGRLHACVLADHGLFYGSVRSPCANRLYHSSSSSFCSPAKMCVTCPP